MSYEWIDRQPYYAQIVDQGLAETKSGKVNLKFYLRILGKVNNIFEPEKGIENIPGNPEVEMVFWFDGDQKLLEFRIKDLQRMGFTGDDITVMDPRHENHQSFVNKRLMVAPNIREGSDGTRRVYWNPLAEPKKKRFVGNVDLGKAKSTLAGVAALINKKAQTATADAKEAAPF